MTAWLLTWLWQGVALVIGLSVILNFLPRVNAATRYVIWWVALGVVVWLGWQSSPHAAIPIAFANVPLLIAPPSRSFVEIQPLPAWALSLVITGWMSVALFKLMRVIPELNALYRLKEQCRPFPPRVEDQLPLWPKDRGRRARLVLCDAISGAAVLGLHEPYIAIPSAVVSELCASDLDQIILHEYGHVQRWDDWARLLQALMEAALWIHPAVFLIGRELSLEREVACDDWVIARTGAPKKYAACLSRAAELRRSRRREPTCAPALFGGSRDLFRRVDRLLNPRRNTSQAPSFVATAIGVLMLALGAAHLRAFPLVGDAMMTAQRGGGEVPADVSTLTTPIVSTSANSSLGEKTTPRTASARRALSQEPVRREEPPRELPPAVTPIVEASIPSISPSHVFDGVYVDRATQSPSAAGSQSASSATGNQPASPATPWGLATDAGVGVGTAAKKASVGLASTFSRAGVSIARSF